MESKNAFTLIEVMVVLSILAIVAILSYNFFGNVMKDAKLTAQAKIFYTEILNLNDAIELYEMKYGELPNQMYTPTDLEPYLVGTGILKQFPDPDNDAFDPTTVKGTNPDATDYQYRLNELSNNLNYGTAANDAYIWVRPILPDVCRKFNELYRPDLGATIPNSTVASNRLSPYCSLNDPSGAAPTFHYIFYVREIN